MYVPGFRLGFASWHTSEIDVSTLHILHILHYAVLATHAVYPLPHLPVPL